MRAYIRTGMAVTALGSLGALAACNFFDVSNPGPVQESFLNDPKAALAIINGAGRDLSEALNWIAYTGGAITREVFPAGSTGSFGISAQQQIGKLLDDDTNNYWQLAQRARFEAEDGARRLQASFTNFTKDTVGAKILLWAGYTNRLLGENMCEAVFDGGPALPSNTFLTRADSELTEALTIATAANSTKFINVARAARAAVRADLGRWTEAAADAASIADNFVYQMPYFTTDQDQYNRIYWATANQPYRAHTVWNTVYDQYYTDTQDPRVAWATDPNQSVGDAAVLSLGRVPWRIEQKFNKRESPISLSTGWEMRLIEAEAKLVGGDLAGAMPLINKHRVAMGLVPWTAATIDEGWTALKRERGIELWLEGRRLGDFRRWKAANRPGTLSPLEQVGTGAAGAPSYLTQQDLCFPIPTSEKQSNPNFQ